MEPKDRKQLTSHQTNSGPGQPGAIALPSDVIMVPLLSDLAGLENVALLVQSKSFVCSIVGNC